ncbi:MAG: ribosomal protein S18-alanine N-acetyltransferase [Cellvibrionaceae bacterium]|nr:ribosomal protein S18-alanine N-acetyltransferase [Cellvibrionaceae bacterium]
MSVDLPLPAFISLAGERFDVAAFTAADLDAIVALEQRSHPHPWSRENFRSSAGHHCCVGLQQGDSWVAYAVLSFVVGEAELLLFVVDKDWQGKGIGSRFLEALTQAAQAKAQTMFLEVRASNEHAIALYEKAGFNQVGLRPGYYPAGKGSRREDALLYALELPSPEM